MTPTDADTEVLRVALARSRAKLNLHLIQAMTMLYVFPDLSASKEASYTVIYAKGPLRIFSSRT